MNKNKILNGISAYKSRFFKVSVISLFTIVSMIAVPNYAFAATAPSLGVADTFGILSGTFTPSIGTTAVTGDLGYTTLSAGTFTVSGATHTDVSGSPAGAIYQQAGSDQNTALNNAINGLNTQTCITIGGTLNGVVIGTNNPGTFPPGCYSVVGAMDITTGTTVTLDATAIGGTGNVWIFKSTGALTTGASTAGFPSVVLANGASASNVFWAPVGATTLGANFELSATPTFVGNILDAAGISLGHWANLSGRALAFGGTVTTDTNTIGIPATSGPVFIDTNLNNTLDGGELFFQTIQAAVNAASTTGDTIVATAGTYNENVTVNKSLTLKGEGDTTIINGNINVTSDNVTIQSLKIINADPHPGYGIKTTAGKTLTLEAVTVDVLHDAISMTGDSTTNDTALTINNSTIKGYGALVISGAINSAGTRSAVVTIHNSNLTGTTQYSGSSDDFSVIGMDNTSNVIVNFTGTNSVANEYTGGAQAKERLITFYNANNNSVTGTPTYTNVASSTVNANALFASAYGPYTNTVAGQVVARYVANTAEFESALSSASTTPVVVGRYETTYTGTPTPIETAQATSTLNNGTILIIEDHNIVTIATGTTLVNNGTIVIENDVIFTNNGTILNNGIITGTIVNNGTILDTAAPVITVIGSNPVTIEAGSTYTDAGATAIDNVDATTTVITSGTVNTAFVGSYLITYNVTDATGNTATVTRTVNVVRTNTGGGGGGFMSSGGSFKAYFNPNEATPATPAVPTVSPAIPATPAGKVLGASTFNFLRGLGYGVRNDDVTELQNRLTAEGVYFGPITGYFGPLTTQGVKNFQKKYGISQVGLVGPQTRAKLNFLLGNAIPGCAVGNKFNTTTGYPCSVH